VRVNDDLAASLRDRVLTLDDELVVGINQSHAVADLRGPFMTADVRERLSSEPNLQSVRRQLAPLVKAGHVDRTEAPSGVAAQFSDPETPGAGQVELPRAGDAHLDGLTQCISDT
jgi:hypothetical protein